MRNNTRTASLVALALALVTVTGCIGQRKYTPTQWFCLKMPEQVRPADAPAPLAIDVKPFSTSERYRDRMVYRESPYRIGFREYHRWVEPPADLATQAVYEMLLRTEACQEVTLNAATNGSGMTLFGRLIAFDEVLGAQAKAPGHAECTLRMELLSRRSGKVVWADTLTARAPISSNTPDAFAVAMSKAVAQIVEKAIRAWQKQLPWTR